MELPAKLVGCSWKSYMRADSAGTWLATVAERLGDDERRGLGVFACVPYPLISAAVTALAPLDGLVGAQDVSPYGVGPFTGEVSAVLLGDLGVRLVMVGHPERRELLHESDATVAAKAAAAAGAGLVPLLIVGEKERGSDPVATLRPQLASALDDVPDSAPVVIAYEPRWAIGQPEPAPPGHVAGAMGEIARVMHSRAGASRILYGGSAGPGTYDSIAAASHALSLRPPDGVFLGRAGLDPETFLATVREVRVGLGDV